MNLKLLRTESFYPLRQMFYDWPLYCPYSYLTAKAHYREEIGREEPTQREEERKKTSH